MRATGASSSRTFPSTFAAARSSPLSADPRTEQEALLRLLGGLVAATSGAIRFQDKLIDGPPDGVVVVFQRLFARAAAMAHDREK